MSSRLTDFGCCANNDINKHSVEVGSYQFIETGPRRIEKCLVVAEFDGDFVYVIKRSKRAGIASKDCFIIPSKENDFLIALAIIDQSAATTPEEIVQELVDHGMSFSHLTQED